MFALEGGSVDEIFRALPRSRYRHRSGCISVCCLKLGLSVAEAPILVDSTPLVLLSQTRKHNLAYALRVIIIHCYGIAF
jgi:hypothetical protein